MLTQERLHQLFFYSPETGEFTRKITTSHLSKANTIAGCLAQGYYKIRVDGKLYLSHRLAWLYVYGEMPQYIDHINRIPTDNKISNLRPVSKQQNQENREKQKNNKSGYKGVSFDKQRKKWFSCIQTKNKTIALGRYETAEMAYEAYKEAAKKYHTHSSEVTI